MLLLLIFTIYKKIRVYRQNQLNNQYQTKQVAELCKNKKNKDIDEQNCISTEEIVIFTNYENEADEYIIDDGNDDDDRDDNVITTESVIDVELGK